MSIINDVNNNFVEKPIFMRAEAHKLKMTSICMSFFNKFRVCTAIYYKQRHDGVKKL